tara:strand:- start:2065 stop:2370 length:306 start_codon:yes stop_codon:yes gene_type:complete
MTINARQLEPAIELIKWRLDELKYSPDPPYTGEAEEVEGLQKTYELLMDLVTTHQDEGGKVIIPPKAEPLPESDALALVLSDIQKTNVELGKQLNLSGPLF